MMELHVFGLIGKKFKIFNPIIRGLIINVVDFFSTVKKSTNMFFHDKMMFSNVFVNRIRMIGFINIHIAMITFFNTFKVPRFFTLANFTPPFLGFLGVFSPIHRRFFTFKIGMVFTYFLSCFIRMVFTIHRMISSLQIFRVLVFIPRRLPFNKMTKFITHNLYPNNYTIDIGNCQVKEYRSRK